MTNQDLLVQAYKNAKWMNDSGEIKDRGYAHHFAELTTLMEFCQRPLEIKEIYYLMTIPYTGAVYDD